MPSNDAFADAVGLVGRKGRKVGTTVAATTEGSEPAPTASDGSPHSTVWYRFTPSSTDVVRFRLSDLVGDPNLVMALYTGSTLAGLTEVSSVFDVTIYLEPTAATTYYLQIGGFESVFAESPFTLEWISNPVIATKAFGTGSFDLDFGDVQSVDLLSAVVLPTSGAITPPSGWIFHFTDAVGASFYDLPGGTYNPSDITWTFTGNAIGLGARTTNVFFENRGRDVSISPPTYTFDPLNLTLDPFPPSGAGPHPFLTYCTHRGSALLNFLDADAPIESVDEQSMSVTVDGGTTYYKIWVGVDYEAPVGGPGLYAGGGTWTMRDGDPGGSPNFGGFGVLYLSQRAPERGGWGGRRYGGSGF